MWTKRPNQYLVFLVDPSFQRVNKLLALSFENKNGRTIHTKMLNSNCRNKGL